MSRLCLLQRVHSALDRDAVAGLAAALRRHGHELWCPWERAGIGGGELAELESAIAWADWLVLVDPVRWWTRGPPRDAWEQAVRRRVTHMVAARISGLVVVVDPRRARTKLGGPLAASPRLVLPNEWAALLELLGQRRNSSWVTLDGPRDDRGPRLPRDHVVNEGLLEAIEGAVAARAESGGLVWLRGGPGTGKSVALAGWLARRAASGRHTPCHVARAGLEWTLEPRAALVTMARSVLGEGASLPAATELPALLEGLPKPLVVALDGLEHMLARLTPARARTVIAAIPAGVVVVVASRALPKGTLAVEATIDLDRDPWRASQAELCAQLIARAKLGEQADSIARVALANPGVARALIDDPAPLTDEHALPRTLTPGLERSWTAMLAGAGAAAGELIAVFELLCVAREPLPRELLDAALDAREREALWVHGRAWLRVDADAVSLVHPIYARFLAPELDLDDPAAQLRIVAALEQLRRRAAVDEQVRAYAERHEDDHELAGYGLDRRLVELLCVDRLVGYARADQLEPKLELALELELDNARRSLFVDLRAAVRRVRGLARGAPEQLPTLLWTDLVAHGHRPAQLLGELEWGDALPLIRLLVAPARVDDCERVFGPHEGRIRGCSIDGAGQRIVTVTTERELCVWSMRTGGQLARMQADYWIETCALSRDGTRCAIGFDQCVAVWDLQSQTELARHEDHSTNITRVAMDERGRVVVSGDRDGKVIAWRVDRDRRDAIGDHGSRIQSCAVSADGRRALTGGENNAVAVWDLEAGERRDRLTGHPYTVGGVALTADGARGVSICIGEGRVWDLDTGALLATHDELGMSTRGCVLVADGRELIAADAGERLHRWAISGLGTGLGSGDDRDAHTAKLIACHVAAGDDMTQVDATPDGRWYLTAGDDRRARVWDRERMAGRANESYIQSATALESSWDERGFWVAGAGAGLRKIGLDGRELERFDYRSIQHIAVGRDRLVLVGSDKQVEVVASGDGKQLARWQPSDDWLRACAIDPGAERIAYAGDDATIYYADFRGRGQRKLRGHSAWIYALAWTPEGRLISADNDGVLKIWNLEDGRCEHSFEVLDGIRALAVDGAGAVFVAGREGAIELLDVEAGEDSVVSFTGHRDTVTDIALVRADALLVSVSADTSLRIWEVETQRELARFDGSYGLTEIAVVGDRLVAGDVVGNHLILIVDWDRLETT